MIICPNCNCENVDPKGNEPKKETQAIYSIHPKGEKILCGNCGQSHHFGEWIGEDGKRIILEIQGG